MTQITMCDRRRDHTAGSKSEAYTELECMESERIRGHEHNQIVCHSGVRGRPAAARAPHSESVSRRREPRGLSCLPKREQREA